MENSSNPIPTPPTGPNFWGRLNPKWSLCSKGRRQSPINVDPNLLLFDPSLPFISITGSHVSFFFFFLFFVLFPFSSLFLTFFHAKKCVKNGNAAKRRSSAWEKKRAGERRNKKKGKEREENEGERKRRKVRKDCSIRAWIMMIMMILNFSILSLFLSFCLSLLFFFHLYRRRKKNRTVHGETSLTLYHVLDLSAASKRSISFSIFLSP